MLPSFAATTMFYYEWTRHEEETILLSFAIASLVVGVVFGTLIVGTSQNVVEPKQALPDTTIESAATVSAAIESAATVSAAIESAAIESAAIVSAATEPNILPVPKVAPSASESKLAADEPANQTGDTMTVGALPKRTALRNTSSKMGELLHNSGEPIALGPSTINLADLTAETQHALEVEVELNNSVEKAQVVAARLEIEVARLEKVAARLEVDMSRSEPKPAGNALSQTEDPTAVWSNPSALGDELPEKAKTIMPFPEFGTVEDWLNHAEMLMSEHNYDDAIKCFDKVTSVDPNNFDSWFLKSVALRRKGRGDDAIYCINFALTLRRTSVVAMTEKGECLLQLGRPEQAIIWFDKALVQDKIAVKPWIGKAQCLKAIGHIKDAIACLDKILLMQPDNAEIKAERSELAAKITTKGSTKAS